MEKSCLPNECVCTNGQGATAEACETHTNATCAVCNPGFHLSVGPYDGELVNSVIAQGDLFSICVANECTCSNGQPATGTLCAEHETNTCASCDIGFHLDQGNCEQNVCLCENGQARTGENCTVHNANQCDTCDDYFHRDENIAIDENFNWYVNVSDHCTKNLCTCENGQAAEGDACQTLIHGANICASCDESRNYELVGSECMIICYPPYRNGFYYRGDLSTTESGYTCQRWDSQDPQGHSRTPSNYPDAGLEDNNFCRNPDNVAGPWCYTIDGPRYEFCAVEECAVPSCYCDNGLPPEATTTTTTTTTTLVFAVAMDSCDFKNDGTCDEESGACDAYTDCSDCNGVLYSSTCLAVNTCPEYPHYTNDGYCDEPSYCSAFTDCSDCVNYGRYDGPCGDAPSDSSEPEEPSAPTKCTVDGLDSENFCGACSAGYTLNNSGYIDHCQRNICRCDHGIGAEYLDQCSVHDSVNCGACDQGHTFTNSDPCFDSPYFRDGTFGMRCEEWAVDDCNKVVVDDVKSMFSDDMEFTDRLGSDCTAWIDKDDCYELSDGYTEDDMLEVRHNCPITCEMYLDQDIVLARQHTNCADAFFTIGGDCDKDLADIGFPEVVLRDLCPVTCAPNHVKIACPKACKVCSTCEDDAAFVDVGGFDCATWARGTCNASVSIDDSPDFQDANGDGCDTWASKDCFDTYEGLSADDMEAIQNHCPIACQVPGLPIIEDNADFLDINGYNCAAWATSGIYHEIRKK